MACLARLAVLNRINVIIILGDLHKQDGQTEEEEEEEERYYPETPCFSFSIFFFRNLFLHVLCVGRKLTGARDAREVSHMALRAHLGIFEEIQKEEKLTRKKGYTWKVASSIIDRELKFYTMPRLN